MKLRFQTNKASITSKSAASSTALLRTRSITRVLITACAAVEAKIKDTAATKNITFLALIIIKTSKTFLSFTNFTQINAKITVCQANLVLPTTLRSSKKQLFFTIFNAISTKKTKKTTKLFKIIQIKQLKTRYLSISSSYTATYTNDVTAKWHWV